MLWDGRAWCVWGGCARFRAPFLPAAMESKGVKVVVQVFTDDWEYLCWAHAQTGREILSLCTAHAPASTPNRFTTDVRQPELPEFSRDWRARLWLQSLDGRMWCFLHESGDAVGGLLDPPRVVFDKLTLYLASDSARVVGYTCDFSDTPRGHALRRVSAVFSALECVEDRKRKHAAAHDALERARKRPRRMADEQEAALLVITAPLTEEEKEAKATLDRWFH